MVGPAEEAPAARGEPRSDEALVEAANRGDEAAFEALYIRHRDYVLRLAYRFTGSSHDALDVLQDAFSYLLGKFPGFTLTARMTTFLYPVVRSLSVDVLRRRRPHLSPEQAEADLPAAPPPPADPAAVPGASPYLSYSPLIFNLALLIRTKFRPPCIGGRKNV